MVGVALGTWGLQNWFGGDFAPAIDLIRRADEKHVDQVSITDHVVMGEHVENYPYGPFYNPLDFPWYEPISVLSAAASVTKTIRLSTAILIAPLRPAVLLAKQLATLDVLSRGRVDIGVGLGWQKEEYEASGVPWEGRYLRLEEQIKVCKLLWAQAPASFSGETVRFDRIHAYPRPVQPRGISVLFGLAPTDKNFARIAELGDGWLPMERDAGKLAGHIDRLRQAFAARDRDPGSIAVRTVAPYVFREDGLADMDRTLKAVPALIRAGVTVVEFHPAWFGKSEQDFDTILDGMTSIR
jgi:probable F420-dependent oxidoreductase